jgi:hypothetical protein
VNRTQQISEQFAKDVAGHRMTVLHEDGIYRHLRFRHPDSGSYWFDLVTWPGFLSITGDMDAWTFSRTEDMFGFFRGTRINPQYWAEKVRAGRGDVARFDEDYFRRVVAEHIEGDEDEWPGLGEAVAAQILASGDICYEEGARAALDAFEFGTTYNGSCPRCDAAIEGLPLGDADTWVSQHMAQAGHLAKLETVEGYRFSDAWEWNLQDWSYQYLWCCHAIQWGIGQYEGTNTPSLASGPDRTPVDLAVTMGSRPVEIVPAPLLGGGS